MDDVCTIEQAMAITLLAVSEHKPLASVKCDQIFLIVICG